MALMKINGREFHPSVLMRAVETIYHHPESVKKVVNPVPLDKSIFDESIHATILGMDITMTFALGRNGGDATYVFVNRGENGSIWRFGCAIADRKFYSRLLLQSAHEIGEDAFWFYNTPTDVERLERDLAALLLTEDEW